MLTVCVVLKWHNFRFFFTFIVFQEFFNITELELFGIFDWICKSL